MGRPPCCDKVGIKKGPWTPEEDIILVSYIQEHGPGNWRSVPTNTGLSRCSKSCRLRWTNYLRPGIKRGNFTPHEEGMIIHLQALLGNKWAAIASYLPQRTDNDIKNYWNTHLKKKLKKFQAALEPHHQLAASTDSTTTNAQYLCKSFNDRTSNNNLDNNASSLKLSHSQSSTTYASSTENISRLLEGWMRSSPNNKPLKKSQPDDDVDDQEEIQISNDNGDHDHAKLEEVPALNLELQHKVTNKDNELVSHEEFESILSFENLNNGSAWDKSTCDSVPDHQKVCSEVSAHHHHHGMTERNTRKKSEDSTSAPPLSFLEKWLLDENVGQVEEMMELSPMF